MIIRDQSIIYEMNTEHILTISCDCDACSNKGKETITVKANSRKECLLACANNGWNFIKNKQGKITIWAPDHFWN